MRKNIRLVFTVLVLVLFLILSLNAFGQENNDEINPQELLRYADKEIFIRSAFNQNFSEKQGYVNEFPNENTIHQYFINQGLGTDVLMSLLPAKEKVSTTNKRLTFDTARKNEFHVTYLVKQSENVPSQTGGKCWIRFSNVSMTGKNRESGIIIYSGDSAYFFSPEDGEMSYEKIADISSVDPSREIKYDIIRLEGVTYVYANGNFLFSYEDEIKEAVSFESGAELAENGNRVRCDFDDFSMRTK